MALRRARAAAAASKEVAAVAPPRSALRAAPVQGSGRPTSARPAVAVAGGPRRPERHPTRAQAQRLGWVAREAARPARPRCPDPTSRAPAGPSWGQLQAEPRRSGPRGSEHGRPQAVPRSSLSRPELTLRRSAAETMGEPAARACRACDAAA